mmetsp:Transcript_28240/g.41722  ORF Transcript_28240/g.41722 Transcript_28240/m.41722 type:complete len:578 (+) Transcript_28240:83-1816(+)
MDSFFNSLPDIFRSGGQDPFFFAQNAAFHQEAMDPQGVGMANGPPPASAKALRQLPTVSVTPEDLVDESNRECCICLEENHLRDRVMRLPCAHIFHQKCIVDWLTKHCTCPVCRYELETGCPQYERSRKARMRSRKPRIHRYVLERMSIQELRNLAKEMNIAWPRRIREKNDILDVFSNSGKIEIIAAPKPVEFELEKLRSMGVTKLRSTMADAGVFFDPRDVVEKEDMVRIFCNSGRLVLIARSDDGNEDDKKPAAATCYQAPDPPEEPSMNIESVQNNNSSINPSAQLGASIKKGSTNTVMKSHNQGPFVETVEEEEERVDELFGTATSMFGDNDDINGNARVTEERKVIRSPNKIQEQNIKERNPMTGLDNAMLCDKSSPNNVDNESYKREEESSIPNAALISDSANVQVNASDYDYEMFTENDEKVAADYAMFEGYTISDLRSAALSLNVDLSSCIERSEIIDKLVRTRNGLQIDVKDFHQWSVSDVRAVAAATGIDLSKCADRDSMVRQLVIESRSRPHIASYLASLKPLAKLSVSDIRNLAREWRVNLNGCIEKEEMIHRLVAATSPSSST